MHAIYVVIIIYLAWFWKMAEREKYRLRHFDFFVYYLERNYKIIKFTVTDAIQINDIENFCNLARQSGLPWCDALCNCTGAAHDIWCICSTHLSAGQQSECCWMILSCKINRILGLEWTLKSSCISLYKTGRNRSICFLCMLPLCSMCLYFTLWIFFTIHVFCVVLN